MLERGCNTCRGLTALCKRALCAAHLEQLPSAAQSSHNLRCLSTPQYTGATLALLPLQLLVVWAYAEHPSELRRLADRDQTYTLQAILAWADAHASLAAGLAGLWLLLQAAAAVLGSVYACCPARQRHPW